MVLQGSLGRPKGTVMVGVPSPDVLCSLPPACTTAQPCPSNAPNMAGRAAGLHLPGERRLALAPSPPLELMASAALNSIGGHALDAKAYEEARAAFRESLE